MRAMSPDSWDATRALELTITPPRICPIGNSQVFQPNTTSCNGHTTFLVFLPLFHSFHSCFYILMVDFVSLLNSIGLYIIQIRYLQTCENWCFGPFSVLRQKIRLIFVDTALHQSSCQKSTHWIPAHPQMSNPAVVGPPVSKCHDKDHLYWDSISTLSMWWRFLWCHPLYLDSQLLKVLSVLWRLIWLVTVGVSFNFWLDDGDDDKFSAWMFGCLAQLRGCRMLNAAKLESAVPLSTLSFNTLHCTL